MQIRSVTSSDLGALAALAAPLQSRPDRHIVYLAADKEGILAELEGLAWEMASAIAFDGDVMLGWLIGDLDEDMGRVWWNGPFVASDDWERVADALLAECRAQLGDRASEEEMAIDVGFERCERWADGLGFVAEGAAYVLTLQGELAGPTVDVRAVRSADFEAVASLHDAIFPNTHSTGRALVESQDETHLRLVVEHAGGVAGYIAVEREADGSGYIDYLGVAPDRRRSGLGGELVRAGVAALRAIDADLIHLTVRQSSAGARDLYASLGFDEERLARPLRLGFSLP